MKSSILLLLVAAATSSAFVSRHTSSTLTKIQPQLQTPTLPSSVDANLKTSSTSTSTFYAPHPEEVGRFEFPTALEEPPQQQQDSFSLTNLLSPLWTARLLLLVAAALYGTNFSVVKILDDHIPVGMASTLRFGLATLVTLPWLLAPPKPQDVHTEECSVDTLHDAPLTAACSNKDPTWGAISTGFEVGLWNSIAYLAQAVGLETTDASKSAFICSLAVVIVPLLEYVSGQKLHGRQLAGAGMAVAGVALLELGGMSGDSMGLSSGDLASLIQPLAFGVAFWKMESAMRLYPNEANRSTAAQLLAVFMVSTIYCYMTEGAFDFAQIQTYLMDFQLLGALVWTGIITTALTVYMEAVALKTLTATETTILLSAEPLFGAACASLLIGESFGMDAAAGAALILGGCIFSNLGLDGIAKLFERPTATSPDTNAKIASPSFFPKGLAGTAAMGGVMAATSATALDDLELEDLIREVSDTL